VEPPGLVLARVAPQEDLALPLLQRAAKPKLDRDRNQPTVAAHTMAAAVLSHTELEDRRKAGFPLFSLELESVLELEYSPLVSSAHGTTLSTRTHTETPGRFSTRPRTRTRPSRSSAFARNSLSAAATTTRTPVTRRKSWATAAMLASTRVSFR
jgi:hypothetical protein